MVRASARGKADIARALHAKFYPLHKDLFIEPNPVPAKRALSWMFDWLAPDVRLPLCEMSPATTEQLRRTLVGLDTSQGVNGENAVSVVLHGANGRMGRAILACAQREPRLYRVHAALNRQRSSHHGSPRRG